MNYENMIKLCDFLDNLEEEKFDFSCVIAEHDNKCATVGCAIGWTPKVFPELVKWVRGNTFGLCLKSDTNENGGIGFSSYPEVAQELFDISEDVARYLFNPHDADKVHPSLKSLGDDATAEGVSNMLRRFMILVRMGHLRENGAEI